MGIALVGAFVMVDNCLRFSMLALDWSAQRAIPLEGSGRFLARFAASITCVYKNECVLAHHKVSLPGSGEVSVACVLYHIPSLSGTSVHIMDCKNRTSSGCFTDSGMLRNTPVNETPRLEA